MWLNHQGLGLVMAAAEVVRARIDKELKQEATAVLSGMGLSLSDAIRLLLVRVAADKAMPFDLRVPNAESQAAIRDIQEGKVTRFDNVTALMADLNS
jgi:DNA-damage-inducible protein J